MLALNDTLRQAIVNTQTGYYRIGAMTQDLIWEQLDYPATLPQLQQNNSDRMLLEENRAVKIDPPQPPTGDVLIGKTGSTAGFSAYVAFVPQRKTGIVVLANKSYVISARVALTFRILKAIAEKT